MLSGKVNSKYRMTEFLAENNVPRTRVWQLSISHALHLPYSPHSNDLDRDGQHALRPANHVPSGGTSRSQAVQAVDPMFNCGTASIKHRRQPVNGAEDPARATGEDDLTALLAGNKPRADAQAEVFRSAEMSAGKPAFRRHET
jgi:hypothetical protein